MKALLIVASIIGVLASAAHGQTQEPWDVQAKICKLPDHKNYSVFPECKLNCTTYKVAAVPSPNSCLSIPAPVLTSFKLECVGYNSCVDTKAWKGNSCQGEPTAKQKVFCGVCDGGQINVCNSSGVTVHQGCDKKTCADCKDPSVFVPANTCFNPLTSAVKKTSAGDAPSVAPPIHNATTSAPISIDERIEVGTEQSPCNYVNVTHFYGENCPGVGSTYQQATDVCNDEIGDGYVVEYSCLVPGSKAAQQLPVAPAHVLKLIGKHLQAKALLKKKAL